MAPTTPKSSVSTEPLLGLPLFQRDVIPVAVAITTASSPMAASSLKPTATQPSAAAEEAIFESIRFFQGGPTGLKPEIE